MGRAGQGSPQAQSPGSVAGDDLNSILAGLRVVLLDLFGANNRFHCRCRSLVGDARLLHAWFSGECLRVKNGSRPLVASKCCKYMFCGLLPMNRQLTERLIQTQNGLPQRVCACGGRETAGGGAPNRAYHRTRRLARQEDRFIDHKSSRI